MDRKIFGNMVKIEHLKFSPLPRCLKKWDCIHKIGSYSPNPWQREGLYRKYFVLCIFFWICDFFWIFWIFVDFWIFFGLFFFGFFNSNCYDLSSMYTIASCIESERFSCADQIVDKNFYASVIEKCIFESNQIFES